ncbi:LytR/AlgR family response regulator transcription factor [Pedobacter deserti]|uniref:LytR/AlgR family response regulator transcription factor n=1 Tax=Pedobacter deserti TaxID=2817382 RepID=UPI00210E0A67|nr:LytTR family DNA-binding domain-containing protein [Pedobacter sp. SYSU D00382]
MINPLSKTEPFSLYLIEERATVNSICNYLHLHQTDFILLGNQENPNIALEEILKKERFPDVVVVNLELCTAHQSNLPELITNHTSLIITSRNAADAMLAFHYKAVGFLINPVDLNQLERALNNVKLGKSQLSLNGASQHFYIQSEAKGKMIRLSHDDIFYVEACQNYVTIHLEKSKYITYLTMKELEQKLSNTSFLRIHKSYLVNESKIHAVDGDYVILENKFFLKIGANYKESMFSSLHPNFFISKRSGVRVAK